MPMVRTLLTALVFATSGWNLVSAHTSVKCRADFKWAENSLGQNPCTMAAYLRSACNPDENFVRTLPRGSHYTGPSSTSESDPCWCSSVTYSLYAACEACQGRSASALPTWDEWTANCETVDTSNGTFPRDIPSGTVIPAWAYGSYSLGQPFVPGNAEESASGNYPESTPVSAATGSSSIGAPTTDGPASTSPNAGSPSGSGTNPTATMGPSGTGSEGAQTESGSSTNKGAIIGGVIGGVVGLLLLLLLAFCCLRRRKQKKKEDEERNQAGGAQHILKPQPGGLVKDPAPGNNDDDDDEKDPAAGTAPPAPGPSNTGGNDSSANDGRGGGNQGGDNTNKDASPASKGGKDGNSGSTKPGLLGGFKRRRNDDSIQKDNTTDDPFADPKRPQVLKSADTNPQDPGTGTQKVLNPGQSLLPQDRPTPPPNQPAQPAQPVEQRPKRSKLSCCS